ncbi:transposase family protein [Nostoc sp.]
MEDQLLMTLEYWREYRTYFHYWSNLGSERVYSISNYPKNRRYTG